MERPDFTDWIFIDFSGDDGDPRITPGASKIICIAWIVMKEVNIRYNQQVIDQIKKTIGCSIDAELKYSSLKHNPHKRKAIRLLSQAKCNMVLLPVVKDKIKIEHTRDPKTKGLIMFLHLFPISPIIDHISGVNSGNFFYPKMIFDELKWKGCERGIEELFTGVVPQLFIDNKFIEFSNYLKYPLLQLADLFAGLGSEFVESLQNVQLPPCRFCSLKKARDCSYKRNIKDVGKSSLMKVAHPLLVKSSRGKAFYIGFIICPPEIAKDYLFIDCLFS